MAIGGPVGILGGEYLSKMWKGTGSKLKTLVKPLLKDGIGDRMDRGNLWVVPGFTLLVFAVLWATKLSKIALEESTCKGASIYDFGGTQLDDDAKRHCQTAKRYFVASNEAISLDPRWRSAREVKNPEWILWFWAPIVFVMYVLTRFMWSLLLENQGINFGNVVSSAQTVIAENEDGITDVDEVKLSERLHVIAENFRCAYSSRAFTAFVMFELSLVVAPMALLLFVLPLMIGGRYRTWGLDIARAWWDKREWQGTPLMPFFDFDYEDQRSRLLIPLIPRYTFCDYNFVSLGNSHTLTYRCYLDANWHERTALCTWILLAFLSLVNFGNLFFWLEWAIRMHSRANRRKWVTRKWLNPEGFSDGESALMMRFAEEFNMSQLLLFYYIEAHTDRVVASSFCTALFARWLEKRRQQNEKRKALIGASGSTSGGTTPGSRAIAMGQGNGRGGGCVNWHAPPPAFSTLPQSPVPNCHGGNGIGGNHVYGEQMFYTPGNNIGWNYDLEKQPLYPAEALPTAPPITSNMSSFSEAPTVQQEQRGSGSSVASVGGGTPKSTSAGVASGMLAAAVGLPEASSTAALIGRSQGRLPNMAAEVGRDSCYYCRRESNASLQKQVTRPQNSNSTPRTSRVQLQRQPETHEEDEEGERQQRNDGNSSDEDETKILKGAEKAKSTTPLSSKTTGSVAGFNSKPSFGAASKPTGTTKLQKNINERDELLDDDEDDEDGGSDMEDGEIKESSPLKGSTGTSEKGGGFTTVANNRKQSPAPKNRAGGGATAGSNNSNNNNTKRKSPGRQ